MNKNLHEPTPPGTFTLLVYTLIFWVDKQFNLVIMLNFELTVIQVIFWQMSCNNVYRPQITQFKKLIQDQYL